jgi:hypothetical protein
MTTRAMTFSIQCIVQESKGPCLGRLPLFTAGRAWESHAPFAIRLGNVATVSALHDYRLQGGGQREIVFEGSQQQARSEDVTGPCQRPTGSDFNSCSCSSETGRHSFHIAKYEWSCPDLPRHENRHNLLPRTPDSSKTAKAPRTPVKCRCSMKIVTEQMPYHQRSYSIKRH